MKMIYKIFLLCLIVISVLPSTVLASAPYQTYTYTYYAEPILSPDAYIPTNEINGSQIDTLGLKEPTDLVVASNGDIYIADTGNNRVVVLNPDGSFKLQLFEFVDPIKNYKKYYLKGPTGVCITSDNKLYIADAGNNRIIVLDDKYNLVNSLIEPKSDIFPEGFVYTPNSLVSDKSGRIYVVVNNSNMGILALKSDGSFESFLGAQKVNPSINDLFWRIFMTNEQIQRTKKFVPSEYNNIAINEKGFIFVTTSAIDQWSQYNTTITRSLDNKYAPVKMLNPSGIDVLKRNGFFPPSGDVKVEFGSDDTYGPSSITDIAMGPFNTYTMVDSRRNKLFTYDYDGNLLFAFAGKGMQTGLFQSITAIAYQGENIIVLDKTRSAITIFKTTDYGKLIYEAINFHDQRKYKSEADTWDKILATNSNFDLAYIGKGSDLMQKKEYKEAMEYFKRGNNVTEYSRAFEEYRKLAMKNYFIFIPILIILFLFFLLKLGKSIKKFNKRNSIYKEKRSIKEQLLYAWYYIFHPFDGAWDLTHENRGGYAGAFIILGSCIVSLIIKSLIAGFIITGGNTQADIFGSIYNVTVPFAVFCIANWCLTSLMDGEGSMKSIIITTAYSLTPLVLITIPSTIIGNFLSMEELVVFNMISSISYLWVGILIFAGTITIHRYSLPKNTMSILLTIVGMAFIIFLALLTMTLGGKMISFFLSLYQEFTFKT